MAFEFPPQNGTVEVIWLWFIIEFSTGHHTMTFSKLAWGCWTSITTLGGTMGSPTCSIFIHMFVWFPKFGASWIQLKPWTLGFLKGLVADEYGRCTRRASSAWTHRKGVRADEIRGDEQLEHTKWDARTQVLYYWEILGVYLLTLFSVAI